MKPLVHYTSGELRLRIRKLFEIPKASGRRVVDRRVHRGRLRNVLAQPERHRNRLQSYARRDER
jgi:hypothetical protein